MWRGNIKDVSEIDSKYNPAIIGNEAFVNAKNTTYILNTREYKINWQKPTFMSAKLQSYQTIDTSD